jgi:hypothetical protein
MESPIDEIYAAFDGVERPRELTLHVAEEHDNYDYSNDAMHRAKDYDGRWQDVPDEHLLTCHWGLTHLGADGLPFYLPAAMIWVLKNFRDTNELLLDWTIYQLNPNRNDKMLAERYDSRFQLFTSAQWCACQSFLKFLLYEDPEGDVIDAVIAKQALAEVTQKSTANKPWYATGDNFPC